MSQTMSEIVPTSPRPRPSETDRLLPSRPVASRVMGERALLLHPRVDEVKLTNEVGTLVWKLVCERRHSIADIAAAVVEAFDVELETARLDVASFVAELVDGGFLEWDTLPQAPQDSGA